MTVDVAFLGLLLALCVALMPLGASALEKKRPGQGSFLTRAVFADGRLWILSDAGDLSSLAESADRWTEEGLPDPVFDLCLQDGHPLAVTGKPEGDNVWTLRRWIDGAWSAGTTVPTEGDDLIALDCAAGGITLLTTRRIIEVDGHKQAAVALSGKLIPGLVASVYGTPDQVFVGVNAGEWGGGLRRIDRRSGQVTAIERNASGGLCGGPLNSSCDPVNGIAAEPWKPGCIAAAVGLVHFVPHGRIVEVCGDRVERLYYRAYEEQASASRPISGDEPFSTVAFFGLVRVGDALWAAGIDGIYRVGEGSTARSIPLPRFERIGDIYVSFELPDLVLVLTDVNQRRSISGSVPIMVPR
jgi:hypothetical protein